MTPAILAEGVRQTFGDVVALDGLDLEVEAGSVFGLLGPNGAGKTTLVRILATLLRPTAGRARVLGHDVLAEPLAVRRRIGLAGQFAAVDAELTGRENVEMVARLYRLPGAEARRRASEVLERFGLVEAADRRASTYSGGMRRRLDLAAGLIGRPPVVLLDEPTTGLDPRSRQELWRIVEELHREGTTVLLTTQYLEEADRLAQRIALVDHGRIVAQGTPAELKTTIGGNVLSVRVADPAAAPDAAGLLADMGADEQPRVDTADGEIRVAVADPAASAEAIRRLDAHGLPIAAVELQRPSLDDVFLALTGRPAGDEPTDQSLAQEAAMSTIDAAIPDRARLTLGETLADSRVMAARQLRKILRRPTYVVYLFVQPVIFVLLFRYVFGGAIDTGDISYVDYLMPGIITMTAIFGALTTGLGLTEDIAGGAVDRFRSLPIARSAVLIGRTAADLTTNAVSLIVMLLIGIAVGFRPSEPIYEVALAFVLVLAFAYVFSWISAFIGLTVRDPETAQSVGFVWVFPLVFASSAFVPTADMPAVVQTLADINPVTLVVDAARALTIGDGDALGPTLGTLAWLIGLLAIFVPLSVRALRRA